MTHLNFIDILITRDWENKLSSKESKNSYKGRINWYSNKLFILNTGNNS